MTAQLEYVLKVAEPVLSPEEASAAIGRLTQTCESLRADLVALESMVVEKEQGASASLLQQAKRAFRRWAIEVTE